MSSSFWIRFDIRFQMKDWLINLFKRRKKITSITTGTKDDKGYADVLINGEKTNIRVLLWTQEDIDYLQSLIKK